MRSLALGPAADWQAHALQLERRVELERRARTEAEQLLEVKSLELHEANRSLGALAADLERRVEVRTRELTAARQLAIEQAETDALTGVANRAAFTRCLDETLADADAMHAGVALLLIDLDDFKTVNDTFGHPAGDALLMAMARRLAETVRPGDVVARLGGDEFAVIARRVDMRKHGLLIANRLLQALCRPVNHLGRRVQASCSIGIAAADLGGNADTLLGNADLALYASKRSGRARVTVFEAGLRSGLEQRARLENEVREAVLSDRIEPWYQPIRDCRRGRYVSAELLARWRTSEGGIRTPDQFLPTVETLGLLDTMMENLLRRALRDVRPLIERGVLEYLSINVPSIQFNHGWAQHALPRLRADTGFPAHGMMIELTETALLDDVPRVRAIMAGLTDEGMRIALGDFGVGKSNFSLLRQLPFSVLKLDRSLTSDMESGEESRAVVECVLALASRLKLTVVAEGVDTVGQSALLLAAGCPVQQGYVHARPGRELGALLSSG